MWQLGRMSSRLFVLLVGLDATMDSTVGLLGWRSVAPKPHSAIDREQAA